MKRPATKVRKLTAATAIAAAVCLPVAAPALASAAPQPGQQQQQPGQQQQQQNQPQSQQQGRHGYAVPQGYRDDPSAPAWPLGGEPPNWWWSTLHGFGLA